MRQSSPRGVGGAWFGWSGWALAVLVAGALPAQSAEAQYFGRNKVRYRDLDFQVLETEHFQVYYYRRESAAATDAAQMAERWYARLSKLFSHELTGKQPLILYASHAAFAQTAAISGQIGEATGGVTEAFKRRIVLPMAGTRAETDHVIGHELVHAFQYDLSGIAPNRPLTGSPSVAGLPLWMIEGMAEYYSIGPRSPLTSMWMRDAVANDRLPTIDDLADPYEYFPYRWGQALWAYIGGRWGAEAPWQVLRVATEKRSEEAGIVQVLGVSPDTLSMQWHESMRQTYQPTAGFGPAADRATAIVTERSGGSGLNVGPALSPDGRRVIFLSSRDPYSIDLYLADAETGEVIRRLTRSALDPHYESLQFVNSAGSWAPDGERIAITSISGGKPSLDIVRAATGERIRTIPLEGLDAAFNPTWSPDGGRIAFVGNEGGYLDLWIATVESGDLRRLTEGPEAELHPAWSPDGRSIAITTDRYGRGYDLALADVETGRVAPIATPDGATNTQPHWGPNGALYFVSFAGGRPNLYRTTGGGPVQVITRLATGVSGITELSPAYDVARESGRIVFTAYERGNHHLYRLDDPAPLGGDVPLGDVALLPPRERKDGALITLLEARPPVQDSASFERRDYAPRLSLDYVAPPSLGFAAGGGGSFIGGGTALFFSDLLGYHELGLQLQVDVVGGRVLDGIGALATYVNRRNRFHWGVAAGQVPQIGQAFGQGLDDVDGDGDTELIQQTLRLWQVSRQATGLFQYPFDQRVRLELSAGFENLSFAADSRLQIFELPSGRELSDETMDAPACGDSLSIRRDLCVPGSLNEFRASAALVSDNTIAGPTGPIAGQRSRFEVSPSVGTLTYVSALADWRGYARLAGPLTLAGRLLHYGRYASDADDQRLSQLFLGFPSLIRGYGSGSFDFGECPAGAPIESCSEAQVYEELFGSRIAVGNAELRLSLFGPVGVLGRSFPVPMDLVGFFDAGVAWRSDDPGTAGDDRAGFLGGDRDIRSSTGVGLRFNLFGFALVELHWVRPLNRPLKGGFIGLDLNTGF